MGLRKEAADFQFVVSTPEYNASKQKDTKKLVRRHAMRRFMKPNRYNRPIVLEGESLAEYLSKRQQPLIGFDPQAISSLIMGSPKSAAALLGAARTNPFTTYSINMSEKDYELVHHIWGARQVNFQPFREYWFTLGVVDPAAMHLVLSNAARHLNVLRANNDENMTILTHNAAAIQSVNGRMKDPTQNTTDEILGAVLGLLCHDYERCFMHMDGLQKMLRVRGGLSSIESIQSVRLSLFWIEHNIAADLDIVPKFPPPFHLLKDPYSPSIRADALLYRDKAVHLSNIGGLISADMMDIFTDLSILTITLKENSSAKFLFGDPDFPGFGLYPVMYKLLVIQARSEQDELKALVQEICRLGGMLIIAEVRRKCGVSPVVTKVQMKKLRNIFETNPMIWDERLAFLRVWVLSLAGCVVSTDAERAKIVEAMIQSRIFVAFPQWDDIIEHISQMWWIDEIFSPKSQDLEHDYKSALANSSH